MSEGIKRAVASLASAWAERDPARRADFLARAVTDDIRMVIGAGQREIRGRAALEAEIVAFQQRVPVVRVRVSSGIDVQGNLCRFTGVVEGPQGQIGPEASDACECDASGRIRVLFTFAGAALPPSDGSCLETGRPGGRMKYAVIIERAGRNLSAYAPDLPGCVATGATREEVLQRMAEAAALHVAGLREDGLPVPEPTSAELDYIAV